MITMTQLPYSDWKDNALNDFSIPANRVAYWSLPDGGYEAFFAFDEGTQICSVKITDANDISDFDSVFKPTANSKTTRDGAWCSAIGKVIPSMSKDRALRVEHAPKTGTSDSSIKTVVTHDYSDKTTWYQSSIQVTEEVLTPDGGTFTPGTTTQLNSAEPNWINIEHPRLFFDEELNPVYIAAAVAYAADPGSNPPPDPADFWYYGPWKTDGTKWPMSHFKPVVQVDPIGDGSWQTVEPDDATYGHRIDYANGRVHFLDTSGYDSGFKVRASYFHADAGEGGSAFQVGPSSSNRLLLPIVEVQLPKGAQWNDTVILYGMGGSLPVTMARYKSYFAMQATATAKGTSFDGTTAGGAAWPASAENGWPHPDNLFDGRRNMASALEIIRWEYESSYDLLASQGASLKVTLGNGAPFTQADGVNVTFYFTEVPE